MKNLYCEYYHYKHNHFYSSASLLSRATCRYDYTFDTITLWWNDTEMFLPHLSIVPVFALNTEDFHSH